MKFMFLLCALQNGVGVGNIAVPPFMGIESYENSPLTMEPPCLFREDALHEDVSTFWR